MNLYVKCIIDIKKIYNFHIDIRTIRFLPDKIKDLLNKKDFS
jgi:hypothetical protein